MFTMMNSSFILAMAVSVSALLLSSASAIRIYPPPTSDYNQAPIYRNGPQCRHLKITKTAFPVCDPSLIHIATTLDFKYRRGSIASVHSILKHAACPENVRLHFITAASTSAADLTAIVESAFPSLSFEVYPFEKEAEIKQLISSAIRPALEDPLNYARIYLSEILDPCVKRVVYLDSDTIVVDDVAKLWSTELTRSRVIGAPVYCAVNLRSYFNSEFWSDPELSSALEGKEACYFNTGVMVMDLERWRSSGGDYTRRIEWWMKTQKERRIYELGSLPPLMLVFGGEVEGVDHRWNQHGLGGDNVVDSCRRLHGGAVSLMHWSGKGKPWVRLDRGRPCPIDYAWAPYDLFRHSNY